jgi:hypothetical protein
VVKTDAIPSRPYSRIKSEPSVTTIIGELNKPGLDWGASKEAALYAVYSQDEWQQMEQPDAVDRIRRHFKGVWDGRAAMGSIVHAVNDAWIAGQSPNVEALVKEVPSFEKQIDEKVAEANRYVDGLERFWNDWSPTEFRSEEVVRTPGQYIGTRDLFGRLRGGTTLLDIKTTAQQDAKKGIYGPEWSLQLAAYNNAREIVTYKRDDKGKVVVDTVTDNERAEFTRIVHLRGDGNYVLFDVDAGPDQFDAFLGLLHLHLWRKNCVSPRPLNPTPNREET